MPRSFREKLFRRWLKAHRQSFNHAPYIVKSRKRYFVINFRGVTEWISCIIGHSGQVEVWGRYGKDRNVCDILEEFDVHEARLADGRYGCRSCLVSKTYESREALWIEHAFEPLAAWVNNQLTAETIVCFFGSSSHSCWARLATAGNLDDCTRNKHFVAAVPALNKSLDQWREHAVIREEI